MGAKAGVRPKESVGEALAAFASAIIAEARAALDTPGRSDAAAVHDFRKAMKRWRAFLRLVEPWLGAEARRLRAEARALAGELAAARDGQSALDALADLGKSGSAPPARSVAAIAGRLEAMRQAVEASTLTETMRARMRTALDGAAAALPTFRFDAVPFPDLAAALTQGYRRARRAIPAVWPQADSEDLHELRQRVVVHRYQIELIEPLWPRLGKLWIGEAQRLRDHLGACQDLAVLGRLTGSRQPLAPWRSRLAPLIAARQAEHVAVASRIAARLFAERPRAFRERLLALWEGGGGAS
ncbi:MAG: CHAD domain-containing protein [Variibacter sp.]|nr:CHAD domain-containing protein [Variibacter sp.]